MAGVEVKVKVTRTSESSRSRSRTCDDDESTVTVDVGYGGAFYAIVDGRQLGLDVRTATTAQVVDVADAVTGSDNLFCC